MLETVWDSRGRMNRILDHTLVGVALLASAGYALASLGPKGLRTRMVRGLAGIVGRAPAFLRLGAVARRLDARAARNSSAACGGCESCGSEGLIANQPSAGDPRAAEVRVPVTKVGRRG
jgi:hypothetical protein